VESHEDEVLIVEQIEENSTIPEEGGQK